MSLGRMFPWLFIAAAAALGLYHLFTGHETAPTSAPAPALSGPQRAPPPQAIEPPPPPEVTDPVDAVSKDATAAFDKLQKDQDEETKAIPPAPPGMGMDKDDAPAPAMKP